MLTEDHTDDVFHALSHRVRRQILDQLKHKPGMGVGELAKCFDISRVAIMNHLAVLDKASLVVSQKDGRARRLYINTMPMHEIYERWSDQYSALWCNRLSDIKTLAEQASKQRSNKE